ncbi:MAG: DUF169 domain-containing protein [Candidatus Methanoperedens sp.]|nr:DUF169 domain-containing protein [Candidatus Methanoperedens sp.]
MDKGKPVRIIFTDETGEDSSLLFCELVQRARFGESFLIQSQACRVGAFVLGDTDSSPEDYYYSSKRYSGRDAARTAVLSLSRLAKKEGSIKITPYSGGVFDVLLLFLKPEKAMRLVQAFTYWSGRPVEIKTGGIASVCSDCTAYPMEGKLGISPGCKGSRKHSRYSDNELAVGIPFRLAGEIDEALGKIPDTFE